MDSGLLRILRWVLVAFGIMLFLAIIVLLFTRPSQNKNGSGNTEQKPTTTAEYSTTGSMRFIQTGNVTAPENHYVVAITISNSSRMIEIYNGYGTPPTSSQSFPNNQASYDAFLGALQGNGFMNTREAKEGVTFDTYCTLGIRYQYQILTGTETPLNTWNASCNTKSGTFAGSTGQVQQLFRNQIPNYNTIVSGVRL